MPVPIQGLFETHLTVANLDRSIAFYRDVLGLELAYSQRERPAAFFWLGQPPNSMLGLWEVGSGPNALRLHLAFTCTVADILAAPAVLKAAGIVPQGFRRELVEEPVVIGWVPCLPLYFTDPDGHLLEYLAVLPDEPRPDLGVVSYTQWQARESR